MPNGYTAAIYEGKKPTLREFILTSLRGMGVCISMRTDAPDAPIPEAFEPSGYYQESIATAQSRVAELEAMDAAQIEAAAKTAHQKSVDRYAQWREKNTRLIRDYDDMIAQVRAWECPSLLDSFKDTMLKWLQESKNFDTSDPDDPKCYYQPPQRERPEEWYADELAEAHRSLEYAYKGWSEELERTRERNEYLAAVWGSLPDD